jgi:hypothetical protein
MSAFPDLSARRVDPALIEAAEAAAEARREVEALLAELRAIEAGAPAPGAQLASGAEGAQEVREGQRLGPS